MWAKTDISYYVYLFGRRVTIRYVLFFTNQRHVAYHVYWVDISCQNYNPMKKYRSSKIYHFLIANINIILNNIKVRKKFMTLPRYIAPGTQCQLLNPLSRTGHQVNLESMDSVHCSSCAKSITWFDLVFLVAKWVGLMSITSWIVPNSLIFICE